jgi:hypothetical protein
MIGPDRTKHIFTETNFFPRILNLFPHKESTSSQARLDTAQRYGRYGGRVLPKRRSWQNNFVVKSTKLYLWRACLKRSHDSFMQISWVRVIGFSTATYIFTLLCWDKNMAHVCDQDDLLTHGMMPCGLYCHPRPSLRLRVFLRGDTRLNYVLWMVQVMVGTVLSTFYSLSNHTNQVLLTQRSIGYPPAVQLANKQMHRLLKYVAFQNGFFPAIIIDCRVQRWILWQKISISHGDFMTEIPSSELWRSSQVRDNIRLAVYQPRWKMMESVCWDHELPNMMGKIKAMFQTTKQI